SFRNLLFYKRTENPRVGGSAEPRSGDRRTNCVRWIERQRCAIEVTTRQFGVFVTNLCVGDQAYKEIVDDGHPIVIIAGIDIFQVLMSATLPLNHSFRFHGKNGRAQNVKHLLAGIAQ
ncbi:MAG: hypothetical protein OES38_09710, partial [Gammaproteobacteria bacterium]|nr:hypothetical protein [Gammaproteobacteria bacterium]